MKVEIKNWLGVMVLVCLGFILGKVPIDPDVTASPQKSEIGRYQLVVGEIEVAYHSVDMYDTSNTKDSTEFTRDKTLFRIDTMTGEVDRYDGVYSVATRDSLFQVYDWTKITGRKRVLP